ncbi:hypothetical protein MMPV_009643 [Pyropia vietnamensis]
MPPNPALPALRRLPPVDVAIVGGGLVGAALATALAANPSTAHLSTLLIERALPPVSAPPPPAAAAVTADAARPHASVPPAAAPAHPPPPHGLRTATLTAASVALLDAAAVTPRLGHRLRPFHRMVVWDRPLPPPELAASFPVGGPAAWETAGGGVGGGGKGDVGDGGGIFGLAGALGPSFGVMDLTAPGGAPMGGVVENEVLLRALYDTLRSSPGAVTEVRASLRALDRPSVTGLAELTLALEGTAAAAGGGGGGSGGSGGGGGGGSDMAAEEVVVGAKLVVGADGARSAVRSLTGMEWISGRYPAAAVVANVTTATDTGVAYQRFLPSGPLAMLPLAPTGAAAQPPVSNIIWSVSPIEAAALVAAPPAAFVRELHTALSTASPQGVPVVTGIAGAGRASFPLGWGLAPSPAGPRVALIGDAAHAVHPLAGQGVNLGVADVKSLVGLLGRIAAVGGDVGVSGREWEDWTAGRLAANGRMMGAIEAVRRGFGVGGVGGVARRVGMAAFGQSGRLRDAVVRYAMGL